MISKRVFCGGMLCTEHDRKNKSYLSGVWVCGSCSVKTRKGVVTIDEFIENKTDFAIKEQWIKLNKVQELEVKKDVKNTSIV